jgi:hypothetical protein
LVILFFAKILAGIFYGWVGVYYANMAQMLDTWHFHYESLAEAQLLRSTRCGLLPPFSKRITARAIPDF